MMKNIDQQEERSQLTREALDDMDTGKVIDHQLMQAWADSLEVAIDQADKGEFASEESVRNIFKKWGVDTN